MHQLIYKSLLNAEIDWVEVVEIAEQARHNNSIHDITGLLITYKSQVLQIIEGSHEPLSNLYLNIANDTRHSNVQLIKFTPINKRNFGKWKMKEIAFERMPENIQSTLRLLMPIEDNQPHLPSEPSKAEAMSTIVAAATSER